MVLSIRVFDFKVLYYRLKLESGGGGGIDVRRKIMI